MSGYCGQYRQLKVFIGQYQYDKSTNTYFDALQVLQWMGTDKNQNAVNSLVYNSQQAKGQITLATLATTGFGYDFKPTTDDTQSAVTFKVTSISMTTPSETFTISFWIQFTKIFSDLNYLFHLQEQQNKTVFSIAINGAAQKPKYTIDISSEQNITTDAVCSSQPFSLTPGPQAKFQQFTISVQPIPQFAQFYSVQIYLNGNDITNYNKNTLQTFNYANWYLTDNIVKLIIGNRTLFQTSTTSVTYDTLTSFVLYDFRIFRGSFVRIGSTARGCQVEIGGLLPHCVLCSGNVADTSVIPATDPFYTCQESRTSPVMSNNQSLGRSLLCPAKTQQTYFTAVDLSFSSIRCYPLKTQGVWRQTINQTYPLACDLGYKLTGSGTSSSCVVDTSYVNQMCKNTRTTFCQQSYDSTSMQTKEYSILCVAGWSAGPSTYLCDTPCQQTSCINCVTASICLACSSPSFLFNGNCLVNCLGTTATYHDTVNNKCQTSCPFDLFIYYTDMTLGGVLQKGISVCISACPATANITKGQLCSTVSCGYGQFTNNQECSPCCEDCIDCYGGSYMECLACVPGKYLLKSICGDECSPPYSYMNPYNNTCDQNCSTSGLQTVVDPVKPHCSKLPCPDGYIKYKIICTNLPQAQTYLTLNSAGFQEYFDCDSSCLSCSGSATNCQSCVSGYYLSGTSCINHCPTTVFQDEVNRICVTKCPSNLLIVDITNVIRSCVDKCPVLNGGTLTTYQKAQYCLDNCGDGYWADAANQYCQLCDLACQTCQTSSTFCQSCSPNFYLYESSCLSACPQSATLTLYRDQVNLKCSTDCPTDLLYVNVIGAPFCVSSCPTNPVYFLYSKMRQCLIVQPYGTYCDTNLTCYDCDNSCKECTGPTSNQCTACNTQTFLENSQCKSDCSNTSLYRDQVNRKCVPQCSEILWVSGMNCVQQCRSSDFTYLGRYCSSNQPSGTYCIQKSCSQCSIECANCTGALNSQCSLCNQNFYLLGTKCSFTCDINLYWNDKINWKCVTSCDPNSYGYPLGRYCDSKCLAYTYINNSLQYCYSDCPEQTYLRVPDSTCQNCHQYCKSCFQEQNIYCYSCNQGYFYISSTTTCDKTCPLDYPWMDVVSWQCQYRCLPSTYRNTAAQQCVSNCPTGSYQYESQKTCVSKCPALTFIQGVSCYDCDQACTQCFGTQNNQCTKCSSYYFKEVTSCVSICSSANPYLSTEEGQCISQCNITQFVEQNLMQCYNSGCPKNPVYFLNIQNSVKYCVKSCPDGFYGSYENFTCITCASQCAKCYEGTQFDCLECKIVGTTINYLYQTSCQDSCPEPLWKDPQNLLCQTKCPSQFFNEYVSTSCVIQCPKYSQNQDCVDECPLLTFISGTQCLACSKGCLTCAGQEVVDCLSCLDGYYLLNSEQCVTTCSPQMPFRDKINKVCSQECIPPLVTNPNNYDCSEYCDKGLLQDVYKCVPQCSSKKYKDAHDFCIPCDTSCQECYGSLNSQCYSCISGYYLEQSSCAQQCSSSFYFLDKVNNICQKSCPQNTFIWVQSLEKRYCLSSCPPSDPLIFINQCVKTCPLGSFLTGTQCQLCSQGCEVCINEQNTSCTKCIQNYYLHIDNQSCHEQCPQNIYQNEIDLTCVQTCAQKTFSIFQYRLSCVSSCPWDDNFKFYQYISECVLQCPQNTYTSGKMCVGCPSSCTSCNHNNVTQCNSCNVLYYLEGSSCVTKCSDQNQFQDQVNWVCQDQCPLDVITFNYPPVRLCLRLCPDGYVAYNSQCLISCPQYTFSSGYFCYDCSVECAVCNGSKSSTCSQCKNGYFLFGTTCSRTCPVGLNQNIEDNTCVTSCEPQLIVADKMICVSQCPTTPDYYYQYNQECVQQCPDQSFQDFGVCITCAAECITCFGPLRSQCTKCIPGFYLYLQFCTDFCPTKYPYRDQVIWECASSCSVGSYIVPSLKLCVVQCPEGYFTFLGQCLDVCPAGYYPTSLSCSYCSFQCEQCFGSQNTNCTSCIQGYYLDNTTCLDKCPKGLWQDTRLKQCVIQCPQDLLINDNTKQCLKYCTADYPYNSQGKCVQNCPSGNFPNSNNFCEICAFQCATCLSSNNNNCQSCNSGYFLYGSQCSSSCPASLYKDSSTRSCVIQCPPKMYLIQEQSLCSFKCPDGQLQDPLKMECVLKCANDMYPDQDICNQCAFECNGCYGPKNSDCKKCKVQFPYRKGICTGPCPQDGYTLVQNQCLLCAFKCLQCQNLQDNCLSCRGNRDQNNNCNCPPGYFDDLKAENCTVCPSICKECTSANVCSKCFNNKIGSDCFCMRPPPVISSEWCIDCNVAYPTISFQDDIDYLTIDFGYQINLNLQNPFSSSNENCGLLFETVTLNQMGQNPLCSLDIQEKKSIIVKLGWSSTIIAGKQIKISQNMVMDISDPSCTQTISMFIGAIVLPKTLSTISVTPTATFQLPPKGVSLCNDIIVTVIDRTSSGGRNFTVQSWTIQEVISLSSLSTFDPDQEKIQLQFSINQAQGQSEFQEQLVIKPGFLKQFAQYNFQFIFSNFMGTIGVETFEITVSDQQSPSAYFTIKPMDLFYSHQDLIIPINLMNYKCLSGEVQRIMDEQFLSHFVISDQRNSSLVIMEVFGQIDAGVDKFNYTLPAYEVSPKQKINITIELISLQNPSRRCSDNLIYQFTQGQIEASFLTLNRLIGYGVKYFNIEVKAFDPDIQDATLSSENINYIWTCTNLVSLQGCKYQTGQTITLPNSPLITLAPDDLIANQTYIFFLEVSKLQSSFVMSQIIAITTDKEIDEMKFCPNYNDTDLYINPTSEITQIIDVLPNKNNKYYFVLMYDWNLLVTQNINTSTITFRMWDYNQNYSGSNKVILYVFPDIFSIPMNFYDTPKILSFEIVPQTGISLLSNFNITLQLDLTEKNISNQIEFFYYFFENIMQEDMKTFSFSKGIPLSLSNYDTNLTSKFPAGVSLSNYLYVLVKVTSPQGSISTAYQQIVVNQQGVNVKDTIYIIEDFLNSSNLSLVQKLDNTHKAIMELKGMEDYSCYKDCSSYGSCITLQSESCICQSSRMLSDCSGTKSDLDEKQKLLQRTLSELTTFTSQLDQQSTYIQRLIFDVQFYVTKNLDIAKVVQTLNSTELINLLDGINIHLQYDLDQMIDFQNGIVNNSENNSSGRTPESIDLGQITSKNKVTNYLKLVGGMLSINSQSFKQTNLNKQTVRQLSKINSKITNTLDILNEIMISIQVPGDPIYSLQNDHATLTALRIDSVGMKKYLKKNYSIETFNDVSEPVSLNQYEGLGTRILLQENTTFYDQLFTIYINNPYSYDLKFPYQGQTYPVFNFRIRQMGRKLNIDLSKPIIFNFQVQNPLPIRLVCIQQNKISQIWENNQCKIKVNTSYSEDSSLVQCLCTNLAITTIISDREYKYILKPYDDSLLLPQQLLIFYIAFISIIYIILLIYGIIKDKRDQEFYQNKQNDKEQNKQIKFLIQPSARKKQALVSTRNYNEDTHIQTQFETNRKLISFSNMIASERGGAKDQYLDDQKNQVDEQKEENKNDKKIIVSRKDRQFLKKKQALQNTKIKSLRYYKKKEKYNCDNYHYQHGLSQVIFRFKTKNPRWLRVSQIYVRYMLILGIGGYLSLLGLNMYLTAVLLTWASFILHFLEYQYQQMLIGMRDTLFETCMLYSRILVQILKVFGALGFVVFVSSQISDQHFYSIQIAAFGYTVVFDLTIFEFIRYLYKRFLGGMNDQELLIKAQKLRKEKMRDKKITDTEFRQKELERLNRVLNA